VIRATDAYHNLTSTHTDSPFTWDPKLGAKVVDFSLDQEHGAHWQDKTAFERALFKRPYVNSEIYYEIGVDDLPTYGPRNPWQQVIASAYQTYLSGGYFAYYYGNTAWDLVKPDPEPPGMPPMQYLKDNLSTLPYWTMDPMPQLAVGGPCLARPGHVYACYVAAPTPPAGRGNGGAGGRGNAAAAGGRGGAAGGVGAGGRGPGAPNAGGIQRGGEIILNLTALKGPATLRWVNTWTGDQEDSTVDGPGVYQLRRPSSFDAAPGLLIVKGASRG
jgi:hypothetical protein